MQHAVDDLRRLAKAVDETLACDAVFILRLGGRERLVELHLLARIGNIIVGKIPVAGQRDDGVKICGSVP